MVDGPDDVRVRGRQPSAMPAVRSRRAVVDDDDLERLGEPRQGLERLLDEPLEVRLLVVGREEVRQPRHEVGGGGARLGRRGGSGHVVSKRPTTRYRLPGVPTFSMR